MRLVFVLQAAGRIDDHVIGLGGFRGLKRVEHHGARVGAGLLADHARLGALAPDFELLDGGGAKRIGRAKQHGMAFGLEMRCEFADGSGLPRPVDADDHDDGGRLGEISQRPVVRLQDFEQILADQPAQFSGIAHQFAVDALADAVEDLVGGGDADIGADQRIFEFFEKIRVDLLAAGNDVFDAGNEPVARFLNAGLEFFK